MFYATATVSLPDDTTIEVRRSFRAPRALVWRAHTEPALLQRWMIGPPGWTMAACEMDVRVGGVFRVLWRSGEGDKEFAVHGVYREVAAPRRLVHTELYGDEATEGSLQTLMLEESAGVTTLTQRMAFPSKAARDAAGGIEEGMEPGFERLDALLATEAA